MATGAMTQDQRRALFQQLKSETRQDIADAKDAIERALERYKNHGEYIASQGDVSREKTRDIEDQLAGFVAKLKEGYKTFRDDVLDEL